MQPTAPADKALILDRVAAYNRKLEAWIARFSANSEREYLWDRTELKFRPRRSLFLLFQARWAMEHALNEGESLDEYRARLRAAYADALANKTAKERAALKTALCKWAQTYDELVAST